MYKTHIYRWMQIRRLVCTQTHGKTCWWKKSIDRDSHSIEWWTADATTADSFGWQDPIPSETSSSRGQVLSQKRNMGLSFRVTQTRPQNQGNRNASTFEERSIEWTLSMKVNARIPSSTCTQKNVHKPSRFVFWESTLVLQSKSCEQCFCSFSLSLRRKRMESLWTLAATLHMMSKSVLSPEEQPIQKSKDPISHHDCKWKYSTLLKKHHSVFVIWTCLFTFNYWKNDPRFRWVNCAKTVSRMNGTQVSHHIRVEKTECTTDNHIPLFLPRRASNRTPDPSSGWREADTNGGRPRIASGLTRRSSSSTAVSPADVEIPPPTNHLPRIIRETYFGQSSEKAQSFTYFPNCTVCRRTKVATAPCKKKSWRLGRQNSSYRKIWRYDNSRLRGSKWRARIEISQICSGCAGLGDTIDSKLSMQKPNQFRRRRDLIRTCRCKFGNLNMKHTRDFQKTKGIAITTSRRKQIMLLKIREKMGKGSGISSMETRRASVRLTNRTESSSTAHERRHATTKPRTCWTTSVLSRIGAENTAMLRDVWRISSCSISRWTRNWSTSTKRSRTSTIRTTSQEWQSQKWCSIFQESDQPRTPEGQQLVRELRSEILQLMPREFKHLLQITIHRVMNDRCNYEKFSRLTLPNPELNCRKICRYDHRIPRGSQWRVRVENESLIFSGCARVGNSTNSKLSMQNQVSSGEGEQTSKIVTHRRKSPDPLIRTMLWNLLKLARRWIGIMSDLRRIDQKQTELQNELYDEWKKELSSSVLVQWIFQKRERAIFDKHVSSAAFITQNYKQDCHVGNHAMDCKLGLFQVADFSKKLADSTSSSGGVMCVSHYNNEAEIISLDPGLRMESIPALGLWNTIIVILHFQAGGDSKPIHQTQIPKHHDPFGEIDCEPPNARIYVMRTAFYISEDNEAEIKTNKQRQCACITHASCWFGSASWLHQFRSTDSDQIRQHTTAIGRHLHRRFIHHRDGHSWQHYDSHHIYSKLFCQFLLQSWSIFPTWDMVENLSLNRPVRSRSQYIAWDWLRDKFAIRMPRWNVTHYFHQITKLEATPSVKNCVSKIFKNSA